MAWANTAVGAGKDETGTTGTLAFTGANTVGSLLVGWLRLASTGSNPAMSDPTNGTWTKVDFLNFDTGGDDLYAFYVVANASSGTLTVTLTNTTSSTRRWTIDEYTHGTDTIALDVAGAINTETGGTALASGAVTTATADELLVSAIARDSGASTNTAASGLTVDRNVATGKMAAGHKTIATASAGNTGDYTWVSNDDAGAGAIVFKATAAGGTTTYCGAEGCGVF